MTEKELAAYFPYKVFCAFKTVVEEENYLFGKTFERVLMPLDLHYLFGSPKRYEYIKPILFPLSMLTQYITINGETFVPIIELAKISTKQTKVGITNSNFGQCHVCAENGLRDSFFMYHASGSFFWQHEKGEYNVQNQYLLFQKLAEWKIDFTNMIEKGEAIAVTNEFNPYK